MFYEEKTEESGKYTQANKIARDKIVNRRVKKDGANHSTESGVLNIYSNKTPCLSKMSSFVIFSGTPRGFVTVVPPRIMISKR